MKNTKLECNEIKDESTGLKTEQYLGNIKSEYILKHIFSYINIIKLKNEILYIKYL